ncbi:unnamed protein product [Nesidiocoris tenuis]|uniref:Uncharacterized protein n=1 Tax=Nesidiocoris tenuis TaxID=355587 RepID=A0A6H5HDR2_9HEMI|nr:unnamed protein product [Nesidiocoris tenuis]
MCVYTFSFSLPYLQSSLRKLQFYTEGGTEVQKQLKKASSYRKFVAGLRICMTWNLRTEILLVSFPVQGLPVPAPERGFSPRTSPTRFLISVSPVFSFRRLLPFPRSVHPPLPYLSAKFPSRASRRHVPRI